LSELYLVRHAKAIPQGEGLSDRDRPLDDKGHKAATALGRWIAKHGLRPDFVLCSPSRRTRQTLEIVENEFGSKPLISFENELYLAESGSLLTRIRRLSENAESVMIVGHNPGLHDLAQILSGETVGPLAARLKDGFPTASLAKFDVLVPWKALDRRRAHLANLFRPKDQKE